MQWLKLHDRSPLHTICADKIRVRAYVEMRLGAEFLVPCLGVAYNPAMVSQDTVRAERFVVKTNHDQGGVFFCEDRSTFDWQTLRAQLVQRLGRNKYYDFREHQYKKIGSGVKRESFYDIYWRRLPFRAVATPAEDDCPRPACLDNVLAAAAIMAPPFAFCRIDFLTGHRERAWFGEVTFHHGAGLIRFQPDSFERMYGDMLDLARLPDTKATQLSELVALGFPNGRVGRAATPAWASSPPGL